MNKIIKTISACLLVGLISVGATIGTYNYLEKNRSYSLSDVSGYGRAFDQQNVYLANLSEAGFPDFTKAAENSIHGVVHIKSVAKGSSSSREPQMISPFDFFFGDPFGGQGQGRSMQPRVGFGSGVIISADGYIITNNHVIEKADEIEVTLNDNRKFTAKLLGTDPQTDIALLKVDAKDLPYIPFGNSDELKVGEWVLAVGNPFNLTSTVTAGIVSAKGRGGIGGGQESIQSYIQTDAAINSGNSGGALVNINGQLIGINTAIYSQTGDFAGYGFAVPVSIAGKVVADIKEYGTVQRAILGVMIQDLTKTKEADPEKTKNIKVNDGVYVADFAEQSPAKQAGIEKGDVITAINDVKVKTVSELQDQVNRHRPGDKVKVNVIRNNSEKKIDVTLKNSEGSTSVIKKTDALSIIGAAFTELSAEKKKELGISSGVEVAGVDKDGKFYEYGIAKGSVIIEINYTPVKSVKDIENIIQKAGNSEDKALFIKYINNNGNRRYAAIDLNEK